jgi:hypothetical protein
MIRPAFSRVSAMSSMLVARPTANFSLRWKKSRQSPQEATSAPMQASFSRASSASDPSVVSFTPARIHHLKLHRGQRSLFWVHFFGPDRFSPPVRRPVGKSWKTRAPESRFKRTSGAVDPLTSVFIPLLLSSTRGCEALRGAPRQLCDPLPNLFKQRQRRLPGAEQDLQLPRAFPNLSRHVDQPETQRLEAFTPPA